MRNRRDNGLSGFTIVELLVVVVIIGILASISYISYMGISQKATVAVLKSDLRNAATTLELDKTVTGNYPANQNDANGGKGLPKSPGTSYQYTVVGNDYNLSATSGLLAFYTSSTLGGTIADGVWSGHTAPGGGSPALRQIALSGGSTCVVGTDSKVYCSGYNYSGQLGNNSTTNTITRVPVDMTGVLNGKTVKSIASSEGSSCVIASDDKAYCWGSNGSGRLGNNSSVDSLVPVAVNTSGVLSGKTIKSLSFNFSHACVVASDDKAYCWGRNPYGALGNNTTTDSSVPVAVDMTGALSGKTIKAITTGYFHTCAVASDDQAYCWGWNDYDSGGKGQLGNNSTVSSSVPVAVYQYGALSGKTVKSIAAGMGTTCVIASDDQVYCWGDNQFGQYGNSTTTSNRVPVATGNYGALSGKTVKAIDLGDYHTCIIASDNLSYCWGWNGYGQLGNSITSDSTIPVTVSMSGVLSGKTIQSLGVNRYSSCVIASDNKPYCWGQNEMGQFGNGLIVNSSVPVAVNDTP